MDILTKWLSEYLPPLAAGGAPELVEGVQGTAIDDRQLAEALTLRGIAVEGVFEAACGGSRFEMDITTNRVDAMNHYGVAREVAAIYGVALQPLSQGPAAAVAETIAGEGFPVRIEAEDLCGRFTARVLRGVSVGPSTGRVAEYFSALGQKPISAPVDATNFGWLAMGQPTHVFDLDTLEGGLVVRRARAGEMLRLLDGTARTLTADDLVIADETKALGLAGVMGGWDSRVTEATRNILVEAAWFDPAAIRASSRRHGIHTDASHRFERGADFNAAPLGNNLVTRLVLEQSGGEVVGPLVDVVIPAAAARTAARTPIVLRVREVQRHLGTTMEDAEWVEGAAGEARGFSEGTGLNAPRLRTSGLSENVVEQYLGALGCELTPTGGAAGEYAVALPSWRLDLEREIDLIEEVARVYGYDRFANTLPAFAGSVVELAEAPQRRTIRETLRGLGFSEAISSTFTSEEEAALFGEGSGESGTVGGVVAMGNPLNAEAGVLRPSLAPGMATMLAHNLHRDVSAVRLFELGTVFAGSTAEVREQTSLALGVTGGAGALYSSQDASALYSLQDALFYQVKGALEMLLAKFAGKVSFAAAGSVESGPVGAAWIASGRGAQALLDGRVIAVWGELGAAELQRRKLRQPCVIATVDAQRLLETPLRQPVVRELSRFQAVERDFSFVFPDAVPWAAIESSLRALGLTELRQVAPVEIFRDPNGKAVAAGSYSLLTRVVFQSAERTLNEEELTRWSESIVAQLTRLGGLQRA